MHTNRDVPLKVAVEGVIAGMAGALALSALVVTGRSLMSSGNKPDGPRYAAGITAAQALAEGPDMPPNMNQVTATFGSFGILVISAQQ